MPDYRTYFDSQCLSAHHLAGKKHVLRIAKVTYGKITGTGGKVSKKPFLHFDGKELPFGICKTDARTMAGMYGKDTDDWVGKWIEIGPSTTTFGGQTVECIRIAPTIPKAPPSKSTQEASANADR